MGVLSKRTVERYADLSECYQPGTLETCPTILSTGREFRGRGQTWDGPDYLSSGDARVHRGRTWMAMSSKSFGSEVVKRRLLIVPVVLAVRPESG